MFQCSKCGECCRHLHLSPLYKELDRGDGVCRYLYENKCSIYEHRPIVCRIDVGYEMFREIMSYETYKRMNKEMCAYFQQAKEK